MTRHSLRVGGRAAGSRSAGAAALTALTASAASAVSAVPAASAASAASSTASTSSAASAAAPQTSPVLSAPVLSAPGSAASPTSTKRSATPPDNNPATKALLDAVDIVTGQDDSGAAAAPAPWDEDASILLLGIRGGGKTSLAILAASCIGFHVVDADQHFYQQTGLPRAVFSARHGFEEYRRRELALMRTLLRENPTRCIIVCGPGSAEDTGQELLATFRRTHPVIYVLRDPAEIDQYLRTNDLARIARLSRLITPSYRALSNFEFYNLSEPADTEASDADALSRGFYLQYHPSLVLKHAEYDFLRLIYSVRDQSGCPSTLEARHSLSFLAPERRSYTYVLPVGVDRVLDIAADLRTTDLIVDVIELVVHPARVLGDDGALDHAAATDLAKSYYTLRRNVRLPIILHIRAGDDEPPGAAYLDVVRHGLRLAPEYLTLDLRVDTAAAQALTAQKHSTKIIGHFYDARPAPGAWDAPGRLRLVQCAQLYGCDLVRICQPVTAPADNGAVQRFRARVEMSGCPLPLIAYNTGPLGRASQYANPVLTPVTHPLVEEEGGGRSGLLTVQAAQRALYASFTLDPLVFGIFGNAVASAMSPVMHNAAFAFCGMPHHYRVFQSSALRDMDGFVRQPNFGGASISAPFKTAVLAELDYISPEAEAIGAVNTLIPLRAPQLQSLVDGNHAGPVTALFGDNTDWIGVYTCIKRSLSPVNTVRRRTPALVLGAGGMAQAAVYALIRLGVQTIFVCNRTRANAEKLVEQFNGRSFSVHSLDVAGSRSGSISSSSRSSSSSSISSSGGGGGGGVGGGVGGIGGGIGSGTSSPRRAGYVASPRQMTGPVAVHAMPSIEEPWPAGISPPTMIVSCVSRVSENGAPLPEIRLPDSWLTSQTGGVVVDLAYNPIDTPLLQQVRGLGRGWITVHGLEVLPEQGIAQFELFTGRRAPEHIMRREVRKYAGSEEKRGGQAQKPSGAL